MRDELEREYEGTTVIEAIVEVDVEEVVSQLNLYLS